nr:heat shock protein 75 kDa, mitochondrial-like [Oncorhynchus nerka]
MSRCLKLFKFALGSSRRANSRLLSSGRGLGSRTVGPFSEDAHVRQQQKQWSRSGMWNPSHPGLGLTQCSYYSTKEAERVPQDTDKDLEAEKAPATEKVEEVENIQEAEDKAPEEEPLHTIIQDTENVQGTFSKHEFQAETKKLLDIVARSLYSEKEVFIRELISNGSDALEKLRHKLITGGGDTAPMEIHLQTDQAKGTFTIQDTGVGMNQEELVANLGTIARSGSKAFLESLQSQAEASSSIIGQFGVGFYSAFMVADRVDVYSQSAEPSSPGYKWSSDGSGVFDV